MTAEESTLAPALRVIRGDATDEELAALLAVLAARSGRAAPRPARQPNAAWADHAAQLRRPISPGPGAWRSSARPR